MSGPGQIRGLVKTVADEHRSAPLAWIVDQVYAGIPDAQFPEIVHGLVEEAVRAGVNRRGGPKGKTREWYAERYEQRRGNKKRTRVGVQIEYCAEGWYSDSGSSSEPMGDAMCSTFPMGRIIGEETPKWWDDLDGWDAFHVDRPVLWKVRRDERGGRHTKSYCDDELPDEYRRIVDGEGHLDGYEVPKWRAELFGEGATS
jgi:hypothetical protein